MMVKRVILLLAFLTIVGSVTSYYTPTTLSSSNRVSARKCAEYSRGVVQNYQSGTLETTGSRDALSGEFPHLVAIGINKSDGFSFYCAGNLISPRFVVTTAHCTNLQSSPDVVLVGAIANNDTTIQVPIKRIIVHPDYHSPRRYDDIALLELAKDVAITVRVRPACLWFDDDLHGNDKAIVVGWEFSDGGLVKVLSKEVFSIYAYEFCEEKLLNLVSRNWDGLRDTQMCAVGNDEMCKITGSPLDIPSKENPGVHYIIGIIAFGPRDCGTLPDVFTRLSKYVGWIESVVWPGE